ncbi:MAG: radical SAM protein [Candidatus Adiutrix sp.]|jgi:MoaA/NifB/PqqE/SkfB family radical SAM enzyme|nr:radical SAM protein [Candidatus Adiutrix sp.]
MLRYRRGPESDPFYWLYHSPGWLTDYDPPREFPFWLNLELTNRCQLDCFFCSRQSSTRPLGDISLETVARIVEEAAAHKECGLRLTGWGEPLLHPQAGEAVRLIKKAGLPLKIYTNGLALTPELMDLFIELEVDDLQFSMQGLTPEQYEFNRRRSSYARLRHNIEMAAARRGNRARPFLSVLTSVLADEARAADPEAFMDDLLTLVDKVAVDLTNLNFVAEVDRVKPFLDRQSGGLSRGRCVDVFLALEIKHDGLIQFCGQDANALEEHSLGRVGEISLAEAWHSPKMNAQRERVGRGLGHEAMAVCRNCYHNTTKYDVFKNKDE